MIPIIGCRYRGHLPHAWADAEVMRAVLAPRRLSALGAFLGAYKAYRAANSRINAARLAWQTIKVSK